MESWSNALTSRSYPLHTHDQLEPLYERLQGCRYVLLGEASHGTSEYYTWRARISKRLIEEEGFRFIAVEGDWPDCYELNRYVKGWTDDVKARDVVHAFNRWPTWMWANWEVVALAEWMRQYNEGRREEDKVGFYGLDVYSLWESLEVVFEHLRKHHPEKLRDAIEAITCFEPFNRDVQEYAWHTRLAAEDCADEVLELLQGLRNAPAKYPDDPEAHFNAQQNARVAVDAERYYRAMVLASDESWNIRDIHMTDTLEHLANHHGEGTKAVVWEHNTHVGDARATDIGAAGMLNVGQLCRERFGAAQTCLVGFGSYEGSVIAGSGWGAPMQHMRVPQARPGSWEALLHDLVGSRLLISEQLSDVTEAYEARGHRAIGVVYNPETERAGNYVPTVLPARYDAFIFLDSTHALHPLHMEPARAHEPPETYPWGM